LKKSKKEWHEFIHYIADNPDTMMSLVASPKHVAIDLRKFGGATGSNTRSGSNKHDSLGRSR